MPPLAHQWQKSDGNGSFSNIADANGTRLTLASVQLADGASYRVVITNPAGTITSQAASLTVVYAPAIAAQPTDVDAPLGGPIALDVNATGTAPLAYQWQKRDGGGTFQDVTEATSARYSIGSTTAGDAGVYRVIITNPFGTVTSATANITVYTPPAITSQPANIATPTGATVSLDVNASGSPPMTFQWQRDINGTWTNISGATGTRLTFTIVQDYDYGSYRAIASNPAASPSNPSVRFTALELAVRTRVTHGM